MEPHLSVILHHDVAVVSVSNSQDKCGDAISGARPREQVNSLVVPGDEKEKTRQSHTQQTDFMKRKKKKSHRKETEQ